MRSEFLAYKYKGLKRVDQIDANVGWKCRKYIRWSEMHNHESDRQALRIFGDCIIDEGSVALTVYGQVTEVLLNVQRWRKDKENLSIEPDTLDEWLIVNDTLDAYEESPQVAIGWLTDRFIDFSDEPITAQITFLICLLDEFFSAIDLPFYESFQFAGGAKGTRICQEFLDHIETVYHSVGLKKHSDVSPSPIVAITELFSDFGFSTPTIRSDLEIDHLVHNKKRSVVVHFVKKSDGGLLSARFRKGRVHLDLIQDHPFFRENLENEEIADVLVRFFECYVLAEQDLIAHSEIIDSFTGFLAIHLAREFE